MPTSTSILHTLRQSHSSILRLSTSKHRFLSTLPSNPHIYIHPDNSSLSESYILSYLQTSPPNPRLAIGRSSTNPPSPNNFVTNPSFLALLQQVLTTHAHQDPGLIAQAAAFASTSGSTLGSGGQFFPQAETQGLWQGQAVPGSAGIGAGAGAQKRRSKPSYSATGGSDAGASGAGGASTQGGYGSGGHTGFMHVADERNPPAYGRIPEPEDIFGSLQVGADGQFIDGHGHYQDSGTYRVLTREGCLGLSAFLRERLMERLIEEERKDLA